MNLTSDAEHQGLTCQTTGLDVFSPENLSRCIEHIRGIQRKLDKAVANSEIPECYEQYLRVNDSYETIQEAERTM